MKNIFAIIILLLLAITNLGSSAPQKKPSISGSKTSIQDGLNEIAKIIKASANNNTATINSEDPIGDIAKLSPQCQAALLSIVTSTEFFQCVPITALLPLLPALVDPSIIENILKDPKTGLKTVQGPLLQFSSDICEAPKCSDDFVEKSFKAFQDGCSKDSSNPIVQIANGVLIFYSPGRDSLCFKDDKSNFCLFEDDIDYIVNLKPSPIVMIDGGLLDSVAASNTEDVCTKCNKAIFNTIFNFLDKDPNFGKLAKQLLGSLGINDESLGVAKFGVALKCSVEFEDGKVGDPSTP